jgi:hypothetical protein
MLAFVPSLLMLTAALLCLVVCVVALGRMLCLLHTRLLRVEETLNRVERANGACAGGR